MHIRKFDVVKFLCKFTSPAKIVSMKIVLLLHSVCHCIVYCVINVCCHGQVSANQLMLVDVQFFSYCLLCNYHWIQIK